MIHTNLPRNCVIFLVLCELTRSAIYGSQKCDSHKRPTVLVNEIKGQLRNFEACSHMHFITNGFKDQLDRTKATCSFNN